MVAMTIVIATQQFNLLHHQVEPCMDVLKSYVKTAMKDAGMKRKEGYQYVKVEGFLSPNSISLFLNKVIKKPPKGILFQILCLSLPCH